MQLSTLLNIRQVLYSAPIDIRGLNGMINVPQNTVLGDQDCPVGWLNHMLFHVPHQDSVAHKDHTLGYKSVYGDPAIPSEDKLPHIGRTLQRAISKRTSTCSRVTILTL